MARGEVEEAATTFARVATPADAELGATWLAANNVLAPALIYDDGAKIVEVAADPFGQRAAHFDASSGLDGDVVPILKECADE